MFHKVASLKEMTYIMIQANANLSIGQAITKVFKD